MNLFAQIADGGPGVGGVIDGPEFGGADMLTGTIWIVDPVTAPTDLVGNVIIAAVALATPGATVEANGLVATLYVDTTGWSADDSNNPWRLKMAPGTTVDPAGTELLDNSVPLPMPIPLTINNGWIEIIPEPGTIWLLLIGLSAAKISRRRRCRRS